MVLHGHKKKVLKEVIRYFVETTGSKYDDFILILNRVAGHQDVDLTYPEWLARKSYDFLKSHDITIQDCIENKDVINSAINADSSRKEGEFYTPQLRCQDGQEYLKHMLGDLWGQAYVWDASCYSMDTELLTNRGWLTYDNLRDDDLVYSLNPDTLMGEFVGFHRRFKKYVKEDLVHFSGKVVDLLVTKDHSMFVKPRNRNGKNSSFEFRSASSVYDYLSSSPSGGNCVSLPSAARLCDLDTKTGYSSQEGLFWKLVGFYIGDGSVTFNQSNGDNNAIRFKLKKKRKVDYLLSLLDALGITYSEYDYRERYDDLSYRFYDKRLLALIQSGLGSGFENKRIPFSAIPTLYYEDLLDGLINSDGSRLKDGLIYYTANSSLADDVELLLSVLGYSVHTCYRERDPETDKVMRLGRMRVSRSYDVYASSRTRHSVNSTTVSLKQYEGFVWDITLDTHHVFKVRRNGKSVFCGNCGAGNLMRTANYPTDKLFLSSLLKEDIEIIQATPEYQGVEAFQLDFLNELDWDRNNMRFSDKLPPRLRQILETNQPLVFFMNPPYKVMEANSSDMGGYMASHGMAKCALDIFHQFMYRLVLLKRTYNLTNVYLGIFGPVTMFHSTMIEPLYNEFKEEFKFVDGFCFDAGEFSGTSESVGWMVGYTTWRTRLAGEQDTSIVLEAKSLDASGNSVSVGKRLVTSVDININTWVQAEDIIRYDQYLPVISTFKTFTDQFIKVPENFLGYIMSSNYAIRATRRACVTSLPTPENIPITEENFWRCVASFTARRCYASKQNPYNNCQYYSMPDTTIEGYDQWMADALVVFLFDYSSHLSAYRDLVIEDQTFNLSNKLFPIDHAVVKQVVTDPRILEDLENFPPQNTFLLGILERLNGTHAFSEEGSALYQHGLKLILQSLVGTLRSDYNYANWTQAWDAGLLQIRDVSGLVPKDDEELYSYLLSKLKHKLLEGVYKFGFLMDTAFAVEDDATFAVEDDAPFTVEDDEPFVIEDEEAVF